MASLITGIDAGRVRENLARVREELPDGVQVLAAVKYVPLDELGTLAEAGIDARRREPRPGPVGEGRRPTRSFRWHFIGQLQSRKVKLILPHVELIHSVASDSALRQLERHGTPDTRILVEVNVAGEADKAGIAPAELGDFIARCPVTVAGLMTMPPFTEDPEVSRPHFAALARARRRARAARSSRWARRRTTASPPRRARRSFAWVPPSIASA